MPRQGRGPRLWLRPARRDKRGSITHRAVWLIVGGDRQASTGCGADDRAGAEAFLAQFLAERYRPDTSQRHPARIAVMDVLAVYGQSIRDNPDIASPDRIGYALEPLEGFWQGKALAEVKGDTCRAYVAWRMRQPWRHARTSRRTIGRGTARRELECLQAAINHYAREHGIDGIVKVTLPKKPASRQRWLTREEAARFIRAAWRNKRHRHLARFILIGLYTGTRHSAILKLKWLPSPDGGWLDLERGVLYRKGETSAETAKKQTPCRIPPRLMPWLRRWKAADEHKGRVHVVSWGGAIKKERRAWEGAREAAELGADVTPHVLRHTAATWLMQSGVDLWQAAGYLGMDPMTLKRVYGHHHPDFQMEAANAF